MTSNLIENFTEPCTRCGAPYSYADPKQLIHEGHLSCDKASGQSLTASADFRAKRIEFARTVIAEKVMETYARNSASHAAAR